MSRRALWWTLPLCLLAAPVPAHALPLGIPAAIPPKFRSLVRTELRSNPPQRHSWEARVDLQPQHGYRLALLGQGNVVALKVMRKSHGSGSQGRAVTVYTTRGTVTSRRIKASFGGFGRVDVRFRPSRGTVRRHASHCLKRHRAARRGVFVGRLRFTGENGYVAVRAHRAKGWVRQSSQVRCKRPRRRIAQRRALGRPVANPRPLPFTALAAKFRRVVTSTDLLAFRIGRVTLAFAVAEQSLGTVATVRYATSITTSTALTRNDALTSATVRPRAPFRGEGLYRAAPDGTKTWSGSLSVDFPGAPRLALTGAEFRTRLRAGF